jgi:hypothetical protein
MTGLGREFRSCERTIHVLAFAADGQITLVRRAVVTLVSAESDVVRSRPAQ